ncbi:hypothetical protein [Chenggangzhangella methanolivorans]|uniref:Uncharacterized protein n=1 Tax=Chenggangzhangella methanolivorans TaxID=1437009 RepID=A0A9E6ULT8_9HYPH|nr:hypothetical protein [Chenggangzhangella methanolivorans]QZN98518.1 hypothetical protein K6K41_15840 [Chenggangzhangella methanolivorans]
MKNAPKSPHYELVRDSAYFDEGWYATQVDPDLLAKKRVDFVQHFLNVGGRNGLAPSRGFVSAAYLASNIDVARAGHNPLVHFLTEGEATGRKAIGEDDLAGAGFPDMLRREERRAVAQLVASPLFDVKFFRKTYSDLRKSRLHPALYYVRHGLDEQLHPSAAFDAEQYLDDNPDAAERGLAPLLHYVRFGEAAGVLVMRLSDEKAEAVAVARAERRPATTPQAPARASERAPETAPVFVDVALAGPLFGGTVAAATAVRQAPRRGPDVTPEEARALELIRSSPLFDAVWYLMEHREAARLAMDPALHYLRHGAPDGLKPSIYFDPAFYLESGEGGVENPLLHYLTVGRSQGRKPRERLAIDEPLAAV